MSEELLEAEDAVMWPCKYGCGQSFTTKGAMMAHHRWQHVLAAKSLAQPAASPDASAAQPAASAPPPFVQPIDAAPEAAKPADAPEPPQPVPLNEKVQYVARLPMSPPEERKPTTYGEFTGQKPGAPPPADGQTAPEPGEEVSDEVSVKYDATELARQLTRTYFPKRPLSLREQELLRVHMPKQEIGETSSAFTVFLFVFGTRVLEHDEYRAKIWGWLLGLWRWAFGEPEKTAPVREAVRVERVAADDEPQRTPAAEAVVDVKPEPVPTQAEPEPAARKLTPAEMAALWANED